MLAEPDRLDWFADRSDHVPLVAALRPRGKRSSDDQRHDRIAKRSCDKVRKLLAKAESTTNPNEAEAFSAKAAELIAAHRLDPHHVRESLEHGALALRRIPLGRGAYVRARSRAAHGRRQRRTTARWCSRPGPAGTVAVVAGFDVDLVVTGLLYESLHIQAANQMATTKRATPAATQRWRRSFLFGYARRIGEMLSVSRNQASPPPARSGPPTLFDDSRRVRAPRMCSVARRG